MKYKIREKLFGANKSSSTGTSMTLNDTVKYPIKKLAIDGVCEQKTTTGKNLLPYPWHFISPTTLNGITITDNNDGKSFTVSGTSTDVTTFELLRDTNKDIIKDDVAYYLQGGKSTNARLYFNTGSMDTGNGTTYTYSSESTSTRLVGVYIPSGVTINEVIYPMLSEGSEATDYEPYTGGQPSPSPDYPQEINVLTGNIKVTSCGKNLLDLSNISNQTKNGVTFTNNGDGTITANGTATETSNLYIKQDYNNKFTGYYSISGCPKGGSLSTFYINEDFKSRQDFGNGVSANWANQNMAIRIRIVKGYTANNLVFKPMLEQGSQPTSYEPYQGSSLNITIPENEFVGKIGDIKDTLNVVYKDDGHYHLILKKMIGKVVLDGSENWVKTSREHGFYISKLDNMIAKSKLKTNYFPNQETATLNGIWVSDNFININILLFDNLAELKSWLSTHNTIIYYILATPYEVDLGIVDTLLTYDEITNIFTDSDLYPVINVDYYKGSLDISNYEFSIKEV